MKFKHLLFGILLSTFFITNSYSLNLNKVYNIKTFSSAKLEINDTNLVEEENAENLLSNNNDLKQSLIVKSGEIRKKIKIEKEKEPKVELKYMRIILITLFILAIMLREN